jgi:hypothetical protein
MLRLDRGLVLLLAAEVIFLAYFYFPWLTGQSNFYNSDLSYYFEPLCKYAGDNLKQGHLPLWNPYLYCGMPQIAVLSPSFLYPPGILFTLLPYSQALAAYMICHQLMSAIGGYLLGRRLGYGEFAAFVLGLSFSMCGYMFTAIGNFTLVATAAWMPFMLYFLRRIDASFTASNLVSALFLSITIFLSITAGRPEVWLASVGIVFVVTAVSTVRSWFELKQFAPIRAGLIRFAAFAGGFALAAPLLLPAYEWTRLSTRAHGMKTEFVMTWSSNWYDWVSMVVLPPLGDMSSVNNEFYSAVGSRAGALPYIGCAYVGPVIVSLALIALLDKNWRWRLWWAALFVVSAVAAAGNTTPIAPYIVDHAPFLSVVRYPVKLLIVPAFVLCVMAARGAQAALERNVAYWKLGLIAAGWFVILATGFNLKADEQVNNFFSTLPHARFSAHKVIEMQMLFAKSFIGSAILGVVSVFICGMHRHGLGNVPIISCALALELLVTMVLCAVKFVPDGINADYYTKPSSVAEKLLALERAEAGNIPGLKYSARNAFMYSDPLFYLFFSDQDPLRMQQALFRYSRLLMFGNQTLDFAVPSAVGYEAANKDAYWQIFGQASLRSHLCPQQVAHALGTQDTDAPLAKFLTNAATKFVVSQRRMSPKRDAKLDPSFFSVVDADTDRNTIIFRNKHVHPRAYFAQDISWVIDGWRKFAYDILTQKEVRNFEETFVEKKPGDNIPQSISPPSQAITSPNPSVHQLRHIQLKRRWMSRNVSALRSAYQTAHLCSFWPIPFTPAGMPRWTASL